MAEKVFLARDDRVKPESLWRRSEEPWCLRLRYLSVDPPLVRVEVDTGRAGGLLEGLLRELCGRGMICLMFPLSDWR